ncbi:MAG: hypothetical protein QOJ97_1071 [Solirubrobacteraceae bacterium]|nr:hypothetical protein [Solirubrobacteraceae bacterium]
MIRFPRARRAALLAAVALASLVGGAADAQAAYTPTGPLVADLGFRPAQHAFSFENYADSDVRGVVNLTPPIVEYYFGRQVCVNRTGPCKLNLLAKQWMDTANRDMGGGHCMGFAVTSLLMFAGKLPASAFGAPSTPQLVLPGNTSLQSTIAATWAIQTFKSVLDRTINGRPSNVLKALISAINRRTDLYTLGIYQADGSGHAITPYAVEDRGSGRYAILVYDNNFPLEQRALFIDTRTQRWSYRGGSEPTDRSALYSGTATSNTLEISPSYPGLKRQPCPFCKAPRKAGKRAATSAAQATTYNEVNLTGNPRNHAHVYLEDPQLRKTGFVSGRFVNKIPGAVIVRPRNTNNWASAPEPSYRFPASSSFFGQTDIFLDGRGLARRDRESLNLIGPGFGGEAQFTIRPGQRDQASYRPLDKDNRTGFYYETDTRYPANVDMSLIQEDTYRGHKVWYLFDITALEVKHAGPLALIYDTDSSVMNFYSVDDISGKKLVGNFAVFVARLTDTGRLTAWYNPRVPMRGGIDVWPREAPSSGRLRIDLDKTHRYAKDVTNQVNAARAGSRRPRGMKIPHVLTG